MKKVVFIFLLLLCVVAGGTLIGCRKPVPPDPCAGLKPVSADFNFYQKIYKIDSLFKVDTVLLTPYKNVFYKQFVQFVANEKNAAYKWELEDYPEKSYVKSFSLGVEQPYGKIEVKLIVKKEPNTLCFPQDDGVDTVTRSLYVLDESKVKPAFIGSFTGYDTTNPNNIFDITIVDFGEPPYDSPYDPRKYGVKIYNFPNGCKSKADNNYNPEISSYSYRNFYIENQNGSNNTCSDLNTAFGKVYDNNNKIEITFLGWDNIRKKEKVMNRKFAGARKK